MVIFCFNIGLFFGQRYFKSVSFGLQYLYFFLSNVENYSNKILLILHDWNVITRYRKIFLKKVDSRPSFSNAYSKVKNPKVGSFKRASEFRKIQFLKTQK